MEFQGDSYAILIPKETTRNPFPIQCFSEDNSDSSSEGWTQAELGKGWRAKCGGEYPSVINKIYKLKLTKFSQIIYINSSKTTPHKISYC